MKQHERDAYDAQLDAGNEPSFVDGLPEPPLPIQPADLIAMGVEVGADNDQGRAFDDLRDLIQYAGNGDMPRGVREIVKMLADATEGAIDVHQNDSKLAETCARMRKFETLMRQALEAIK